jgi:AraC-like DNA-binding protein
LSSKYEFEGDQGVLDLASLTGSRESVINPGPDDQVHSVDKLAMILNALVADGVSEKDAVAGVGISIGDLSLGATRVSINQTLDSCRNALRLAEDPHFAFRTGKRFRPSTYGWYGLAILCSPNFRRSISFIKRYRHLAVPLLKTSWAEDERVCTWTFAPLEGSIISGQLYDFLIELQFGAALSLLRDVMGPTFFVKEIHLTRIAPDDAADYPNIMGCDVLFGRSGNRIIFDVAWLDQRLDNGNEHIHLQLVELCDDLMTRLESRTEVGSKVRQIIRKSAIRPPGFDDVARRLDMSSRTLRRNLTLEHTSYRKLTDEIQLAAAIKVLRDTDLSIEDIADELGFSGATSFRKAFLRWSKVSPSRFRKLWRGGQ